MAAGGHVMSVGVAGARACDRLVGLPPSLFFPLSPLPLKPEENCC